MRLGIQETIVKIKDKCLTFINSHPLDIHKSLIIYLHTIENGRKYTVQDFQGTSDRQVYTNLKSHGNLSI